MASLGELREMAYWRDPKRAQRRGFLVGNAKRLRESYTNEADARAAAVVRRRIQRRAATMEISLAIGQPLLTPQSPVTVSGYKPTSNVLLSRCPKAWGKAASRRGSRWRTPAQMLASLQSRKRTKLLA